MAVSKRFNSTKGERSASVVADVGLLKYTVALIVDGQTVEQRTGMTPLPIDSWAGDRVYVTLSGEAFTAHVSLTRNDVSCEWK